MSEFESGILFSSVIVGLTLFLKEFISNFRDVTNKMPHHIGIPL